MARLGLKAPEISSQITQPEYVADYVYALASCWGVLANLADDCRHLLRSEIRELADRKESDPGTEVVGSSTMPHKINPKDFENVKSLWKAYVPRLLTVLLDQVSEHQRDLTNSASMRFVTEFVTAFAYGVHRLSGTLDGVEPDAARMREYAEGSPSIVTPLNRYLGYDEAAAVALRREVALLAAVDHPGLARVHEVGVADGRPYLLMERVEGETIPRRILRDPALARAGLAGELGGLLARLHAVPLAEVPTVPAGGEPLAALVGDRNKLPARLAIAVGNEGSGLSAQTRAGATKLVAVEIGPSIESLNVAVATGIMLYELQR
jgi:hypothetical protein